MLHFKEQRAEVGEGPGSPFLRGTWHKHKHPAERALQLWVSQGVDRPLPPALPLQKGAGRTWNVFEGRGVPPEHPSPTPASPEEPEARWDHSSSDSSGLIILYSPLPPLPGTSRPGTLLEC